MEIKFSDNTIELEKELNVVDKFTVDMTKIFNKYFDYVIVSGYLSILFGKPRGTEDVDIFTRKVGFDAFKKFCDEFNKDGYEILNTGSIKHAYEMLTSKEAIRIAKKGTVAPNIEMKFEKDKWSTKSLNEKIKVILNENYFYISPIEMNIAYKLHMHTPKDIDDACHVYLLFKKLKHLNENELINICKKLKADIRILKECR